MSSFPGGPFPSPLFPPQDVLGSTVGNHAARIKALEAVVPSTFEFVPDRPFAFGGGTVTPVPDGLPFVSVIYELLTPFDTLSFDPDFFNTDSSNNLYCTAEGVYQLAWTIFCYSTVNDSAPDQTFRGPIWVESTVSGVPGYGFQQSSYADNTGVYNEWSISASPTNFVTALDIPAQVALTMGQYCINTGPMGTPLAPIDMTVQWVMMVTYLDTFSPTQP